MYSNDEKDCQYQRRKHNNDKMLGDFSGQCNKKIDLNNE
jgi:hypothetical protein